MVMVMVMMMTIVVVMVMKMMSDERRGSPTNSEYWEKSD